MKPQLWVASDIGVAGVGVLILTLSACVAESHLLLRKAVLHLGRICTGFWMALCPGDTSRKGEQIVWPLLSFPSLPLLIHCRSSHAQHSADLAVFIIYFVCREKWEWETLHFLSVGASSCPQAMVAIFVNLSWSLRKRMPRGDCSRKGFEHGVLNFFIYLEILGQDAGAAAAAAFQACCLSLEQWLCRDYCWFSYWHEDWIVIASSRNLARTFQYKI